MSQALQQLSVRAEAGEVLLNYTSTEGPRAFREALSTFISNRCSRDEGAKDNACRTDGLFTTGGVSHGLDLACAVFGGGPGNVVLVESPSYFLAFEIFRAHGLSVVPVPTDEKGVRPEELEDLIDHLQMEGRRVTMLYVVATHSNPSSTTLPLGRRKALVEIAERYKLKILADEVYHLLDWSTPSSSPSSSSSATSQQLCLPSKGKRRPSRMATLDARYGAEEALGDDGDYAVPDERKGVSERAGTVLSISAFTKIFCPGMRLGWIEAAPSVIRTLSNHPYVLSGGGLAPLQSQLATELLLSKEQDAHLDGLISDYESRSRALTAALLQYQDLFELAGGARAAKKVEGGYFVWVKLLQCSLPATELREMARREFKVDFLPGERCHPDPLRRQELDRYIRLCFANIETEELLVEGVHRLARAVRAARNAAMWTFNAKHSY